MSKHFERKQAERFGSQVPYTEPSWGAGIKWGMEPRLGATQYDQLPLDKAVLLNDSLLNEGESIRDTVLPWIQAQGIKLRRYERVRHDEIDRIAFTFKNKKAAILFKLTWG